MTYHIKWVASVSSVYVSFESSFEPLESNSAQTWAGVTNSSLRISKRCSTSMCFNSTATSAIQQVGRASLIPVLFGYLWMLFPHYNICWFSSPCLLDIGKNSLLHCMLELRSSCMYNMETVKIAGSIRHTCLLALTLIPNFGRLDSKPVISTIIWIVYSNKFGWFDICVLNSRVPITGWQNNGKSTDVLE